MIKTKAKIDIGWNFDNSYTKLPKLFFTEMNPEPVSSPNLVVLNISLAKSLGLNAEALSSEDGTAVLAGNKIPNGATPLAQAYAGHQFGHFTMLGDGRAMLLGEHIIPQGDRFDIQLKGSGKTPYSRGGDGRAALGPMLREYIISEGMHGLRIPSTRSLSVVTTGEKVIRETDLTGAILTRIASSHIRVGTFEYASQWGSIEDLRNLADYSIKRHFPHVKDTENKYLSFLEEVVKAQASLIAKWQLVGFIHGVMNTDNMAISGETIDYGPCAFMDNYNIETVFSSIDTHGRYAYGNQPNIAGWNLARFAETLLPLIHNDENKAIELAQIKVSNFNDLYEENYTSGMRRKLGLSTIESEDTSLIRELLRIMEKHNADYTNTFRSLTLDEYPDMELFNTEDFKTWHKSWQKRLDKQNEVKFTPPELMKNNNPAIIPRNHRVEEALKAADQGDYSLMEKLVEALKDPYAYSQEQIEYATLPEPSDLPYRTFCGT